MRQLTKTMLREMPLEESFHAWRNRCVGDAKPIAQALRDHGFEAALITRAANCLANCGFNSLDEARNAFLANELDLTEIPNFGAKCATALTAIFMGRQDVALGQTALTVRYKKMMSAKRAAERLASMLDDLDPVSAARARELAAFIVTRA